MILRLVSKLRVSSNNDTVLSKYKRRKIFEFVQKKECLPDILSFDQYFF